MFRDHHHDAEHSTRDKHVYSLGKHKLPSIDQMRLPGGTWSIQTKLTLQHETRLALERLATKFRITFPAIVALIVEDCVAAYAAADLTNLPALPGFNACPQCQSTDIHFTNAANGKNHCHACTHNFRPNRHLLQGHLLKGHASNAQPLPVVRAGAPSRQDHVAQSPSPPATQQQPSKSRSKSRRKKATNKGSRPEYDAAQTARIKVLQEKYTQQGLIGPQPRR